MTKFLCISLPLTSNFACHDGFRSFQSSFPLVVNFIMQCIVCNVLPQSTRRQKYGYTTSSMHDKKTHFCKQNATQTLMYIMYTENKDSLLSGQLDAATGRLLGMLKCRLVHGTYFSVPSHPILSHGIPIIILIWNTVQIKLGTFWKFRFSVH